MKLATFASSGAPEIGIVDDKGIVSITRERPNLAANMIDLIARWDSLAREVRALAESSAPRAKLESVRLLAPVPRPGKILAIGLNYADHVAETGREPPAEQTWFAKMPTAAAGVSDAIEIPKASTKVDWEAELVAIIGKGGRHIAKGEAKNAVFGYAVGNDVSARDWQFSSTQWILGKSFDTHAPFGPWITTADELGDPHGLGIRCFVNGQKRQESNTCHFIFNLWDQIAHVSKVTTLEPGDVIYTGTPAGVGNAMKPPQFLKPGDRVRVEIDKLGALDQLCKPEE
jgi:2-keto-4-pentenoate hydratase/2-oxohepta-3-ene-1,7-dioic acid hydratase in catechol pathway